MFRQTFTASVHTEHVPVAASWRSSWPEFRQEPQNFSSEHVKTHKQAAKTSGKKCGGIARVTRPPSAGLLDGCSKGPGSQSARRRLGRFGARKEEAAKARRRWRKGNLPTEQRTQQLPRWFPRALSRHSSERSHAQLLSLKAETQQSRKFPVTLAGSWCKGGAVETPPVMVSHSPVVPEFAPAPRHFRAAF